MIIELTQEMIVMIFLIVYFVILYAFLIHAEISLSLFNGFILFDYPKPGTRLYYWGKIIGVILAPLTLIVLLIGMVFYIIWYFLKTPIKKLVY